MMIKLQLIVKLEFRILIYVRSSLNKKPVREMNLPKNPMDKLNDWQVKSINQ